MYILPQERPQNVNFRFAIDTSKNFDFCICCKHSEPNMSYPKDEMDCNKTKSICNALCTCDCFEEDF